MNDNQHPVPSEINLHRKSRILNIRFSDGKVFNFPCEYLRVYSRAAEVSLKDLPETGKEEVNIDNIEPQGSYAIRIVFDDGHDTGIYSWETLYDLGVHQDEYWQKYLDKLTAAGYTRKGERLAGNTAAQLSLKLMYFSYLANKLGKESEQITAPASITDVQSLLAWLSRIKGDRGYLLAPDNVRATVNRQFAEAFTRLEPGDEVGIIPLSPNPPAPPK